MSGLDCPQRRILLNMLETLGLCIIKRAMCVDISNFKQIKLEV